jgi:hypothetical protein
MQQRRCVGSTAQVLVWLLLCFVSPLHYSLSYTASPQLPPHLTLSLPLCPALSQNQAVMLVAKLQPNLGVSATFSNGLFPPLVLNTCCAFRNSLCAVCVSSSMISAHPYLCALGMSQEFTNGLQHLMTKDAYFITGDIYLQY